MYFCDVEEKQMLDSSIRWNDEQRTCDLPLSRWRERVGVRVAQRIFATSKKSKCWIPASAGMTSRELVIFPSPAGGRGLG
jgi:hypothetical protein